MELSEDDVLHILKLIDESTFDYFQLEMGDLKITVSKGEPLPLASAPQTSAASQAPSAAPAQAPKAASTPQSRSEEHTSELQSRGHLVCRLLLEKKKHTKD